MYLEGSETILLAEDDRSVRIMMTFILRGAGYEVEEASNGQEAVDLLRERSAAIDLAVVDLRMPVKSGEEVARFFLSVKPEARIIFSSGAGAILESSDFGATSQVAFVHKPVRPSELLAAVRHMLDDGHDKGSCCSRSGASAERTRPTF